MVDVGRDHDAARVCQLVRAGGMEVVWISLLSRLCLQFVSDQVVQVVQVQRIQKLKARVWTVEPAADGIPAASA